jgi:hypothetical protein
MNKTACKVGDKVYQTDSIRVYESTITDIIFDRDRVIYYTDGIAFDNTAINHSIFLTREEAERKITR